MLPPELPQHFRSLAATLRDLAGDSSAARAYEKAAELAEAAWREFQGQELSLQQASEESGYSVDHLQRLVAEQRIPNAGRKGKPRVRRGDLPTKLAPHSGSRVASTISRRAALSAIR